MDSYPLATQHPLKNHSVPGSLADKDLIVLHITEGSTAQGAIATFEQSTSPHRVSAHFIIDQKGAVIQLLPIGDVAWHASQVNGHSIGIEHVAISGGKLPITDAQYSASSLLVKWLCTQLGVPVGRSYVRTHNEASPRDGHTLCCAPTLDPDKVVQLASEVKS